MIKTFKCLGKSKNNFKKINFKITLDQMKTANFTVEGDLNINLLDVTNKNVE